MTQSKSTRLPMNSRRPRGHGDAQTWRCSTSRHATDRPRPPRKASTSPLFNQAALRVGKASARASIGNSTSNRLSTPQDRCNGPSLRCQRRSNSSRASAWATVVGSAPRASAGVSDRSAEERDAPPAPSTPEPRGTERPPSRQHHSPHPPRSRTEWQKS